jgi:hypothetical protein
MQRRLHLVTVLAWPAGRFGWCVLGAAMGPQNRHLLRNSLGCLACARTVPTSGLERLVGSSPVAGAPPCFGIAQGRSWRTSEMTPRLGTLLRGTGLHEPQRAGSIPSARAVVRVNVNGRLHPPGERTTGGVQPENSTCRKCAPRNKRLVLWYGGRWGRMRSAQVRKPRVASAG